MFDAPQRTVATQVCPQGVTALLLMLALPLASASVADLLLLWGVEKEGTTKNCLECDPWASDSRSLRQRSAPHVERVGLVDLRHYSGKSDSGCRLAVAGHRLANGLCAPLRC
jgi:hypothetical protein